MQNQRHNVLPANDLLQPRFPAFEGQKSTQDFELIGLLINEPGPSLQQFRSFQARFQSFVDQIPSYLHFAKKGAFLHFLLGGFSVVQDTKIGKNLGVSKVYFGFSSAKTLKIAVVTGEINNLEDIIASVKLFVISEGGADPSKKFRGKELIGLFDKPPAYLDDAAIREIESGMKVRAVDIDKQKGKGISIHVQDKDMTYGEDGIGVHKFTEIKKGLWNSPESDIENCVGTDLRKVSKAYGDILKSIGKIHSKHARSLKYGKSSKEAAHQAFLAGALFMNFHYGHNFRISLELLQNKGYADFLFLARGKDRSLNSIPFILECKSGKTTIARGLSQSKEYAKGFQPNSMRVLTTSDNILYAASNFDLDPSVSEIKSLDRSGITVIPLFQDILSSLSEWNNGEIENNALRDIITSNLKRIYGTFPGTSEKADNHYFSRFLLGQSLLLNRVDNLGTFKKYIFDYRDIIQTEAHRQPDRPQRRAAQSAREGLSADLDSSHAAVTLLLVPDTGRDPVYVINVVEADRNININLPHQKLTNRIGEREIVELNLSFNTKNRLKDFSEYLTVGSRSYDSVQKYAQGRVDIHVGDFTNVDYPDQLKETFDKTLDHKGSSTESLSENKFNELFTRIGTAMLPIRNRVDSEAHFQAVLHGIFAHYSDLKLRGSLEDRVLVITEFQTGRGKRIDMLIQTIKFTGQPENYTPLGLELKISGRGKTAEAALEDAEKQIRENYSKGVTYKTLTDGDKVKFIGVVFDRNAENPILISKDELSIRVVHSSIPELSPENRPGCSNRGKRNIWMPCVDSRSEKEIIEQRKYIQELIGDELIKKINLKKLESEVLNRYNEITNIEFDSTDKNEILDNAYKATVICKSYEGKISQEIQKKAYYNALFYLGLLLSDHTNHVQGDYLNNLNERIRSSSLLTIAQDIYFTKGNTHSYEELLTLFLDKNIDVFQEEIDAYTKEVITIHPNQILNNLGYILIKVKGNLLIVGSIESLIDIGNYILDEEAYEIKLRVGEKKYTLIADLREKGGVIDTRYYFNLSGGYRVKLNDLLSSTDDKVKQAIHNKLNTLELLDQKKHIDRVADLEIDILSQEYEDARGGIKEALIEKGIGVEHSDELINGIEQSTQEIFGKYISDLRKKLLKNQVEFSDDKFDIAKKKGIKIGKLFSLMAVYGLIGSIRDVSTLGRPDNNIIKKIFTLNGILDSINDVRESLSVGYVNGKNFKVKFAPNSLIGKITNKIPTPARKAFVKFIDNPVVRGITFATISYQFGYSAGEIAKGNHNLLNYYWTGSSGVKLASMGMGYSTAGASL